MASPIVWVAGPVQYWEGNYSAFDMAWDFIGGNAAGEIRRWRLRYKAERRAFTSVSLKSDRGDQSHATKLRKLYQPIAVLRRDLPKGAVQNALRAMVPESDIAAALRMSITKGKRGG